MRNLFSAYLMVKINGMNYFTYHQFSHLLSVFTQNFLHVGHCARPQKYRKQVAACLPS
jgi:hypothetical protein